MLRQICPRPESAGKITGHSVRHAEIRLWLRVRPGLLDDRVGLGRGRGTDLDRPDD